MNSGESVRLLGKLLMALGNEVPAPWSHPVSVLVSIVVLALVIRFVSGSFRGRKKAANDSVQKAPRPLCSCFFSAVLFVNGLAHFSHGISGERFPAPFGYLVGTGFHQNLSNVVWGFLNAVLGYALFVRGEVGRSKWRKITFFSGMLAMGIFLSFVFSHHAQR